MQNTGCEPSEAATASAPEDEVNAKYRHKYRRLKRYMKDLVFENAALCDHIAQVQEKISQRSEERRFMLKKLLDLENEMETQLGRPSSKLNELIASSLPPKRQYKKREKNASTATNGTASVGPSGEGGPDSSTQDTQGTAPDGVTENGKDEEDEEEEENARKSGSVERHGDKNGGHRVGKKRGPHGSKTDGAGNKVRRKARLGGTGTGSAAKRQRTPTIPVDEFGHPSYPITIGNFTVHNLGEVVPDRTAYHTNCTIYPIGYTVTRPYGHYKDPEKRCNYTCRIVDDGERPRFEIVPECSDPTTSSTDETREPKGRGRGGGTLEDTISGSTTDGCHAELLQRINMSLNVCSIDSRPGLGDWFFGLAHPTIANLIASFPSAKRCANFRGSSLSKRTTMASVDKENDPTLSYDALVRHVSISAYRTVPEIKEEPPDELFDHSDGNSFSLSV
uniref:INO80 complex subunit E N-terminal domain-containing protein n=1 Tax=Anopheles epiroticus TaxID=199890 RepID=A0A182PMP9_9DIPT